MRQKVKTFFYVFKRSLIPNSNYYKKIIKTSFSFSFRYFFFLIFLLNLIFFYQLLQKYNIKKTSFFINRLINEIEKYPHNLIINIKNGYLITNQNQPYFFWGGYENKRLWLVIDESADNNKIVEFYNSYFLINKKNLIIKPNFLNSYYKIIPLTNLKSLEISKKNFIYLAEVLKKINNKLLFIYIFTTPILFILIISSSFLISLFYLLIITFLVYQFFKFFFHRRIHFKKSFQLSFHAATLPLIIDYLAVIWQLNLSFKSSPFLIKNLNSEFLNKITLPFPVAFIIILTIFIFFAIYEAYQDNHNHYDNYKNNQLNTVLNNQTKSKKIPKKHQRK